MGMSWEDELGTLARERGPALVGYAYLLTGDLPAAEDLVQEGLVRTFSRRRAGADIGWLEAYVRRTILNVYLDAYRRRTFRAGVAHLVTHETGLGPAPDAVAAERTDVHAALGCLSPRERACMVLRHYEDLTVPEIARRLALSEGAVKRYLSDAGRRLVPLLTPRFDVQIEDVSTTGNRGLR
jgi:RNA polymerase sigma factor (sigma-70 family)